MNGHKRGLYCGATRLCTRGAHLDVPEFVGLGSEGLSLSPPSFRRCSVMVSTRKQSIYLTARSWSAMDRRRWSDVCTLTWVRYGIAPKWSQFRVEQHLEVLKDRLGNVAFVTRNVTPRRGRPRRHEAPPA
jgi:hypothetical protein